MLKHYKCDTSEFTGLKETLEAVKFFTEHEKLADELAKAEVALAKADREYKSHPASILDLALSQAEEHNDQELSGDISGLVARIQSKINYGNNFDQEMNVLLSRYYTIDTELMIEELGVEGGADLKGIVTKAKTVKTKVETKIEDLWSTAEERCFNSIPHRFAAAHASKREAMQTCLSNFMVRWRRDSKCFPVPVTIYGIEISSMPEAIRRVWSNAYSLLELKPNVKPQFIARKYSSTQNGFKAQTFE